MATSSTAETNTKVKGSCHCRRVTVEIPSAPDQLTECRCSLCYRYGALWAYYRPADVEVLAGDGTGAGAHAEQKSYVRSDCPPADGDLGFYFCDHCGCMTHWWGIAGGKVKMGVNFRMFSEELADKASREVTWGRAAP